MADDAADNELRDIATLLAERVAALGREIERMQEINDRMSAQLLDVGLRYTELQRRIDNLRQRRRATD